MDTWTETSKKQPKKLKFVLGIFQERKTGWINPVPYVCSYMGNVNETTTADGWMVCRCTNRGNVNPYYRDLRCVAWTDLPEPYVWEGK